MTSSFSWTVSNISGVVNRTFNGGQNCFKRPGCIKRKCPVTFATHNLVWRQSVRRQTEKRIQTFQRLEDSKTATHFSFSISMERRFMSVSLKSKLRFSLLKLRSGGMLSDGRAGDWGGEMEEEIRGEWGGRESKSDK